MQDGRKTKAQLIRELEEIRRRLAEEDGSKNPRDMLVFLQALIDTIPSSIFYKDREGIYRGCNRAYENFLGLKKREIVGKTLHEIFPGDLADKYGEMDRKLFENPGQQEYEWQMSSSDGTRHD
ncbi:MAG TPA: PAS domain S-box protein, partial [Syntrophales bacterium]|nr:PAS domain S-box protein [Syntrophales bacterium]